jgi:16S rRNA processing protein RimM
VVQAKRNALVIMGRVSAPYGLKGWIKVQAFTHALDGLLNYQQWWIGDKGEWRQHRISESAVHGSVVVAHLEGFNDRNAATSLRGRDVAVSRDSMPEIRGPEFYWSDLLGLEVVRGDADRLGRITKILETGANSVLVVTGDKEVLIPFIEGVIVQVDLKAKKLTVDWDQTD